VESFLVMARVDAHEERNDLVSIEDVLRRALRRCAAQARDSGVVLRTGLAEPVQGPGLVRGDSQLLQAMVENLLRNAIQYSPRGSEVRLEWIDGAQCIRIAVTDQGPGIPEQYRDAVFERGVRLAQNGNGHGGVGLGLAIVRSVARLHGGDVGLEHPRAGGCRFVIELPRHLTTRATRAGA
jgi:signal transduction histidine kinase